MEQNAAFDVPALLVALLLCVIGTIGILFFPRAARKRVELERNNKRPLTAFAALYPHQNPLPDRSVYVRLFLGAFGLRILFTFVCFQTGFINRLGGADDLVWMAMWDRARFWETSGPDPIFSIFDPATIKSNPAYHWIGSYFYFILQARSQMALAFINCFLNALTVVLIYRIASEFFDKKAALFAGTVAAIMPGFLVWSALTIKETWLIFLELAAFYFVCKACRERSLAHVVFYSVLLILLLALTMSFRHYVAYTMVFGIVISVLAWRSRAPLRSAAIGMVLSVLLLQVSNAIGVTSFDLASFTASRNDEITAFREAISDASQEGTNSAVILDYDTTTPEGAVAMLTVGSFYVLMSPFPWQVSSLRQLMTLPDVLLWWYLVLWFMIPGLKHAWRTRPQFLVSVMAFALPLLMFYGMMFANIGLAYRQRAQMMPFFLLIAAAGYEKRRQEKESRGEIRKSGRYNRGYADLTLPKSLRVPAQNPAAQPQMMQNQRQQSQGSSTL
jgi:hypothetical protein